MSRLRQFGAELNDPALEFYSTSGTVSAQSTTTHNSRYAFIMSNGAVAVAYGVARLSATDDAVDYYGKFDFQHTSGALSSAQGVASFYNVANVLVGALKLSDQTTLQMYDNTGAAVGSPLTIATSTWYEIQWKFGYVVNASTLTVIVNGTLMGTVTVGASTKDKINQVRYGTELANGAGQYNGRFDNIFINVDDNSGTHDGYPDQRAYLLYAHPASQGDVTSYWSKSSGAAGDNTNYTQVDEVLPDDATTYIQKTTNAALEELYDPETLATMGYISSVDTIVSLAVGAKMGGTGATDRFFKYELKTVAGAVNRSAYYQANANSWFVYDVNDVKATPLHRFDNLGYTGADIAAVQFGLYADDANSRTVRATAVWLEIEYVPRRRLLASLGVGI